MTHHNRKPIGPHDVVTIQGRYLVHAATNNRFLMEGIAFPISLPTVKFDLHGWLQVLEQLATETSINTIRVYQIDCLRQHNQDYDTFLKRAAELGIYVIVPLTASSGMGDLKRDLPAPACYPHDLYKYGQTCQDLFMKHPNVLAGVIGNEVMNSLEAWSAAPCIAAYAHDLKLYMTETTTNKQGRTIPLLYAAQHNSVSAEVLPDVAMKYTMAFLSCNPDYSIDMFGINVESWCSSLQTFEHNEDGILESAYHALWTTFQDVNMPLVFSEMGCSKNLFNRDNGLERYERDWKQVPVVLSDMVDVFSGFCAYAYDGNPEFRMMDTPGHYPWDGHDAMLATPDYDNFRHQLDQFLDTAPAVLPVPKNAMAGMSTPSCDEVFAHYEHCCKVTFFPFETMPTYYTPAPVEGPATATTSTTQDQEHQVENQQENFQMKQEHGHTLAVTGVLVAIICLVSFWYLRRRNQSRNEQQRLNQYSFFGNSAGTSSSSPKTSYMSIPQQEDSLPVSGTHSVYHGSNGSTK